jgi:hypothetical protein
VHGKRAQCILENCICCLHRLLNQVRCETSVWDCVWEWSNSTRMSGLRSIPLATLDTCGHGPACMPKLLVCVGLDVCGVRASWFMGQVCSMLPLHNVDYNCEVVLAPISEWMHVGCAHGCMWTSVIIATFERCKVVRGQGLVRACRSVHLACVGWQTWANESRVCDRYTMLVLHMIPVSLGTCVWQASAMCSWTLRLLFA